MERDIGGDRDRPKRRNGSVRPKSGAELLGQFLGLPGFVRGAGKDVFVDEALLRQRAVEAGDLRGALARSV
jgi:hypothetical protein